MKNILPVATVLLIILVVANFAFIDPREKITTKAELGKKLFNEKLLSKDSSISCASCHKPEFAFADTAAFSTGIFGKLTSRNTPSVLNMKNRPYYFWDGRATNLEEQSLMPIANPDEMGLPIKEAVARLNRSFEYKKLFQKIFHQPVTAKNLAAAFAALKPRWRRWTVSLMTGAIIYLLCQKRKKGGGNYLLVVKPNALIVIPWRILLMTDLKT